MLPALLLTAGLGTRLRPLSSVRAKPAVPVAGEPLVRRILGWLASQGVGEVVLNLHHLPESVCAVVGDGADLGLRARYSFENPLLGSAGGPRRALPLLGAERFLVVNGDTLTDLRLAGLIDKHARSGALVTLSVVPNTAPHRYGGVLVGGDGEVTGFVGRGSPRQSWHFIGVQVAEAAAFADLPADLPAESIGMWYPKLLEDRPGCIRAIPSDASFSDIGTPADYLATSLALAGPAASQPVLPGPPLAGSGCEVSPTSRLLRTVLWDDVVVADGASLIECVVADGVRVPAGARWQRKAVVPARCCQAGPGDDVVGDLLLTPLEQTTLS